MRHYESYEDNSALFNLILLADTAVAATFICKWIGDLFGKIGKEADRQEVIKKSLRNPGTVLETTDGIDAAIQANKAVIYLNAKVSIFGDSTTQGAIYANALNAFINYQHYNSDRHVANYRNRYPLWNNGEVNYNFEVQAKHADPHSIAADYSSKYDSRARGIRVVYSDKSVLPRHVLAKRLMDHAVSQVRQLENAQSSSSTIER